MIDRIRHAVISKPFDIHDLTVDIYDLLVEAAKRHTSFCLQPSAMCMPGIVVPCASAGAVVEAFVKELKNCYISAVEEGEIEERARREAEDEGLDVSMRSVAAMHKLPAGDGFELLHPPEPPSNTSHIDVRCSNEKVWLTLADGLPHDEAIPFGRYPPARHYGLTREQVQQLVVDLQSALEKSSSVTDERHPA